MEPNVKISEIVICKTLWDLKGATKSVGHLGLLMSRAEPTGPQRYLLWGSKFLHISSKGQISYGPKLSFTS